MNKKKHGLAPIFSDDSAVLILGSMPGEESLRKQEYYGYPRNQFWRIISQIQECTIPENYSDKEKMLLNGNIALWDVIGSCIREGSLDSNIREEKPNAVIGLIDRIPGLIAVFFNGKKAFDSFNREFGYQILEDRKLEWHILPSTSPANTMAYEEKYSEWRRIKNILRSAM